MSPRLSGRALVILKSDFSYFADVEVRDGLVHASRVRRKIGRNSDAYYQPVDDRFWPPSSIREVRWQEPDAITLDAVPAITHPIEIRALLPTGEEF